MSLYEVPAEKIRRELNFSNSRFITTLAPAIDVRAARDFITRMRAEFHDASHNVPAFLIGGGSSLTEHCSDDGEPSGTAGRPALAVLRGSGLGDVVVVVTRYFGGAKLGAGGLVKAYTESVQEVVKDVPRARKLMVHSAVLAAPYPLLEQVHRAVGAHAGEIIEEDFAADVTLSLQFPVEHLEAFQNALLELSAGKLQAEIIETKEMLVRVSPP
ncbi:MAG: YigZ family protein [Anaerolineales bacterium]|nr:YigZ family protein [Anaerolineales bacterium]